jgi:hypothetical protein
MFCPFLRQCQNPDASQAEELAPFIVQGSQQAFEVLTARAAGPQMRRHARVTLLGGTAGGGYLGIDVQYLHRLGASHILRIGPQEAVKRPPAVHLPFLVPGPR